MLECFLALRGSRTLALRLRQAQASAEQLAARLAEQPCGRPGALPRIRHDRELRARRRRRCGSGLSGYPDHPSRDEPRWGGDVHGAAKRPSGPGAHTAGSGPTQHRLRGPRGSVERPRCRVARDIRSRRVISDENQRMADALVGRVRSFNSIVTQRVGAFDDRFLGPDRPLGQDRLMWEIGIEGCEVRSLRSRLGSGRRSRQPAAPALESRRAGEGGAEPRRSPYPRGPADRRGRSRARLCSSDAATRWRPRSSRRSNRRARGARRRRCERSSGC